MSTDANRMLVRIFEDYDILTPHAAAELIRDWFSARRVALSRRPDILSIIEKDVREVDRWIDEQCRAHPDEGVREFWAAVHKDLLYGGPRSGRAPD